MIPGPILLRSTDGDNLFTITDYPGIDPEFTDNMNYYANLRQYTIGLNIKF